MQMHGMCLKPSPNCLTRSCTMLALNMSKLRKCVRSQPQYWNRAQKTLGSGSLCRRTNVFSKTVLLSSALSVSPLHHSLLSPSFSFATPFSKEIACRPATWQKSSGKCPYSRAWSHTFFKSIRQKRSFSSQGSNRSRKSKYSRNPSWCTSKDPCLALLSLRMPPVHCRKRKRTHFMLCDKAGLGKATSLLWSIRTWTNEMQNTIHKCTRCQCSKSQNQF